MSKNSTSKLYKENLNNKLRVNKDNNQLGYCTSVTCLNRNSIYLIKPPPVFDLLPPPNLLKFFLSPELSPTNTNIAEKEHFMFLFLNTLNANNLNTEEKCESLRMHMLANNPNLKSRTGYVNANSRISNKNNNSMSKSTPNNFPPVGVRPKPIGHNSNKILKNNEPSSTSHSSISSISNFRSHFFSPQIILFLISFLFVALFVLVVVYIVFKRKNLEFKEKRAKLDRKSTILKSDSLFIANNINQNNSKQNNKNPQTPNFNLNRNQNNLQIQQEQYQELLFNLNENLYNNLMNESMSPLLINSGGGNANNNGLNYLIQNLNNENIILKTNNGGTILHHHNVNGALLNANCAHLIPINAAVALNNQLNTFNDSDNSSNVYEQINKYDTNRRSKKKISTLERQQKTQNQENLNRKYSFQTGNSKQTLSTSLLSSSSQNSPNTAVTSESTTTTTAISTASSTSSTSSNCSTGVLPSSTTHPQTNLLSSNPNSNNMTANSLAYSQYNISPAMAATNTLNKIALLYTTNGEIKIIPTHICTGPANNLNSSYTFCVDQHQQQHQQASFVNHHMQHQQMSQNYANNFNEDNEQVYELIDDNTTNNAHNVSDLERERRMRTFGHEHENLSNSNHLNQQLMPHVLLINNNTISKTGNTLHNQKKYPKTNPNYTLKKSS